MKRIYILILIILCLSSRVFADHDDRFLNSLKNCIPYTSNGAIDTQNISADYKSTILGWDENKCVYQKNVNFLGIDTCIECKFSQSQINNLVNTMSTYALSQEQYEKELDLSNLESLQNNPVVKVWSSYFNDPSTCIMHVDKK